jgi:uncharacterized protein with GYD domain
MGVSNHLFKGGPMATYIVLTTLTDEGAKTLTQNPNRLKEVNKELKDQFQVEVKAQYAVLGPYDFVNIVEAPDDESLARAMIHLSARGSLRTQTLKAIPVEALLSRLK